MERERLIRVDDRFLPPSVAEKYGLDMPKYQGVDQIVETARTDKEAKIA